MPETALAELKKVLANWEKQKNNNLTDARICDAYIKATSGAIELIEQENTKKKTE